MDGKEVARKQMKKTIPFLLQWDETFDVGTDTGTPVDDNDYQVPFSFTGKILKLTIELKEPQLTKKEQELFATKGQRNNQVSE